MNDQEKIESLFNEGLQHYRAGNYFEAHESWEELWSDYYLEDRKFIQGLIQLSVSFVHLENNNLKGAKSLLNKCKEKFMNFKNMLSQGKWKEAAVEGRDSLWYRQVTNRAERLMRRLEEV